MCSSTLIRQTRSSLSAFDIVVMFIMLFVLYVANNCDVPVQKIPSVYLQLQCQKVKSTTMPPTWRPCKHIRPPLPLGTWTSWLKSWWALNVLSCNQACALVWWGCLKTLIIIIIFPWRMSTTATPALVSQGIKESGKPVSSQSNRQFNGDISQT